MIKLQSNDLIDYWFQVAGRMIYHDDEFSVVNTLPELIDPTFPPEISDPITLYALWKIAVAAAAVENGDFDFGRKDRVPDKIAQLNKLLSDPGIWHVLGANLGVEQASDLIGSLRSGLQCTPNGERDLSDEEWDTLHQMSSEEAVEFVEKLRTRNRELPHSVPQLGSHEIGKAALSVLRNGDQPTTRSLLVEVLEAIRSTTGFKTNSEETASAIY